LQAKYQKAGHAGGHQPLGPGMAIYTED
jgi:hypothetical protein